jgi:hypothetical protein
MGANIETGFQIFLPDDLAAVLTLEPQAFGADALFAVIGLGRTVGFVAFEPGHQGLG